MNDGDCLRNAGEIERFFYRRVTTTDNADILTFVEKAITGRTARYTPTHKSFFAR